MKLTTGKKSNAKTNRNRASMIPLALGVGVGAMAGIVIPHHDGGSQIIQAHASEVTAPTLPKSGANFLTEMGDVSNYNLVFDASSVRYHNGLRWVSATLPGTVFDVKEHDGKLYATASGKYDGKILRYNDKTRVWDTVGTTPEPIYDLVITKDGKFVSGGGAPGTYGTDFGIYSSVDGDSAWATRVSGYKSNSGGYTGNLGIFYTGIAVNEQTLMFGVSGNWTFIHGSNDGKNFSYKQEIYGGYMDAVHGGGKVVAVGYQASTYDAYGSIATANEGGQFTVQKMGRLETFSGVAYGNGMFVAVGQGVNNEGVIHTSPDGVQWSKSTVPSTAKALSGIGYDEKNKRFVAVGRNGTMLVSIDAKEWVSINTGTTSTISSIEFSDNALTAYDYSVDAFEKLITELRAVSYKTFTAEDKNAYTAKLNAIVENQVSAITTPEMQEKLKTQYVKYTQDIIDSYYKSSRLYADFLVLKAEVEAMPSVTLEDVNAQVAKLTAFEKTFSTEETRAFKTTYVTKQVTFYVEKAEKTLLRSDYDFAKNSINSAEYSSRSALDARLMKIWMLLPIKEAELAVEKAEKSLLPADFTDAQSKAFYLNSSPEKTALQKRVAWVSINMAKAVLKDVQAKPFISYDDMSRLDVALNKVERFDTEIINELVKLRVEQNILTVKYNVRNALGSYGDSFANSVSYYYGTIPADHPEKELLRNDVAIVAEMKLNKDKVLVIQSFIKDPKSVVKKEQALVAYNSLSEGVLKSFFAEKLGLGDQSVKQAETLLADLTKNFSVESVAKAEETIAKVQDSATKAKLTAELAKLVEANKVAKTETAVSEVEQTPSYEAVEAAREAVNAILDEVIKANMNERLDAIVEELKTAEATIALTELVEEPSQEAYDATIKLIEVLTNESVKADMTTQAEKALESYKVSVAQKSVDVAKAELTRDALSIAKSDVEKLKDSEIKNGFLDTLNTVLETIQINEAQVIVDAVKATPLQAELDKAVALVNELKDGDAKTTMLNTLEEVQQSIFLDTATELVAKATETMNQADVDAAKQALALVKDNTSKAKLDASIQLVQDIVDAKPVQDMLTAFEAKLNAINKRPKSPEAQALTNEYNTIVKQVAALNDGVVKTELTNDLKEVKSTLDAVIKNGNHPQKAPGQIKKTIYSIIGWVIHLIFGR